MPKWQGGQGGGGPSKKKDQNPYNDQRVMSSDPKKALYEICNKFGWPCEYQKSDGAAESMSVWRVEVRTGLGDAARFEGKGEFPDTKEGTKEGHTSAAREAVQGLRGAVDKYLSLPVVTFDAQFDQRFSGEVVESNPGAWEILLKSGATTAVGVDVEGTNHPFPKLVQVASRDIVIIEFPAKTQPPSFSKEFCSLFANQGIKKVFCDHSGTDKKMIAKLLPRDEWRGPIVELEEEANQACGERKAARGLARICGIGMGGVRFEKSKSGWRFFEYCGDLKSMQDLPGKNAHYAAMDAWFTLEAHVSMCEAGQRAGA